MSLPMTGHFAAREAATREGGDGTPDVNWRFTRTFSSPGVVKYHDEALQLWLSPGNLPSGIIVVQGAPPRRRRSRLHNSSRISMALFQFIQLTETAGLNGQQHFAGLTLTSTHDGITKTFTFPDDLPTDQTAHMTVVAAVASDYGSGPRSLPQYLEGWEMIPTTRSSSFRRAFSPRMGNDQFRRRRPDDLRKFAHGRRRGFIAVPGLARRHCLPAHCRHLLVPTPCCSPLRRSPPSSTTMPRATITSSPRRRRTSTHSTQERSLAGSEPVRPSRSDPHA